ERPGSRPLRFEAGEDIGSQLLEWPVWQTVKVLCFYHPDDPAPLRADQERQLGRLFEACRRIGRECLIEIVAGRHGELDADRRGDRPSRPLLPGDRHARSGCAGSRSRRGLCRRRRRTAGQGLRRRPHHVLRLGGSVVRRPDRRCCRRRRHGGALCPPVRGLDQCPPRT
ncbi:MAG: DUF2090 domain-containing protein, partial [Tabrizicola sp.]|nr:DUF2090 domain-containing protein [Tabrizicola sp.]